MSFTEFIEHAKTYNKDDQFQPDAPKEIIIEKLHTKFPMININF